MKLKVEYSYSAKVSAEIEVGKIVNNELTPTQKKHVDRLLENELRPKLLEKMKETMPKTTIKAIG